MKFLKFISYLIVGIAGLFILAIGKWFFESALDVILAQVGVTAIVVAVLILGVLLILAGILILSSLFRKIRSNS